MARHAPRCALCGAPTRPQSVGGVQSLVCVACGAATVDQRALEQLVSAGTPPATPARAAALPDDLTLEEPVLSIDGLAALGEAGFESELEHLRAQRRRQVGLLATMAGMVFMLLLMVPVVIVGISAVGVMWGDETPDSPPPMVAPPVEPQPADAEPEAEPSPVEDQDLPEAPEPAATPEPEAPAPAPAPEAAPPKPVDPVRAKIKEGWAVASRQPEVGAAAFREALVMRPGNPEASYGLGYCLMKQGDLEGARGHLCTARSTSDADIRRDVEALLANNGLTCSP